LYDLVIKGGKIVNGAGNPWFKADVAIKNGKIAEIGLLGDVEAEKAIDADGLVVSPGFVDLHNHSDFEIMLNPRPESIVRHGVALIVVPNCGSGVAPLNEEMKEELRKRGESFSLCFIA